MIYIVIYTFAVFILTTHLLLALGWCFYSPLPTLLFCLGGVALCGSYYLLGKIISKNKNLCPGNTFVFTSTLPTLLTIITIILISTSVIAFNLTEPFMKSIGCGAILFLLELFLMDSLLDKSKE